MGAKNDRRYLQTHEWHKLDEDVVTIGVSQFAVEELTDVTYVDVFEPDGCVKAGQTFGEIESVKATSELYSGVDGTVIEVNQAVLDNPALLNDDPYGAGWVIKVRADNPSQVNQLLDADAYDSTCGTDA